MLFELELEEEKEEEIGLTVRATVGLRLGLTDAETLAPQMKRLCDSSIYEQVLETLREVRCSEGL